MSLDDYVKGLSSKGELQSTGVFTIGWQDALKKLKAFKAGDPDTFLLLLVSAGIEYGARSVSIDEQPDYTELIMHECYVSEAQVRTGFHAIVEGSFQSASFDLATGLHSGLLNRFSRVELCAEHPTKACYRWVLSDEQEQASSPLSPTEKAVTRIKFFDAQTSNRIKGLWDRWFGSAPENTGLGGYVGMSAAARLVDKRCHSCEVPVSVGRNFVNRPIHLPPAPIAARVGAPTGVRFRSKVILDLERENWTGVLVYQAGPLKLVVNGLSYPKLEHAHISGTVWTKLDRDLSRDRLLFNDKFDALMKELESVTRSLSRAENKFMKLQENC